MVQKSLLPTLLEQDKDFEIAAFSESADEVGGDYYDTLRVDQDVISIIVGRRIRQRHDGGIHMSQMKGSFTALRSETLSR
jgi:hypothetical protein